MKCLEIAAPGASHVNLSSDHVELELTRLRLLLSFKKFNRQLNSGHPVVKNQPQNASQTYQTNAKCERVSLQSLRSQNIPNNLQLQPRTQHKSPTTSRIHKIRKQRRECKTSTKARNQRRQTESSNGRETQEEPQRTRRRLWLGRHTPRLCATHEPAIKQTPYLWLG